MGIDSRIVSVETDISDGMPMFSMVGYLSSEVKEAKDRVRTALKNLGISLPVKRITVNITPASIKKTGTGFDLPVAVGVLSAMGLIPLPEDNTIFIGEIGLSGKVMPIKGILPMIVAAKDFGITNCIVPFENISEARLVPSMNVVGIEDLGEVISYLGDGRLPKCNQKPLPDTPDEGSRYNDFSDINGMMFLRRACEVAVNGLHNLLMVGPPGAGKTYISKALPTIMPPLDEAEKLEISKIYSVCGLFGNRNSLMGHRPFRSPHHTISDIGLTGGGSTPRPGEISLAHKGILFLDELLEFKRSTIEILRQPLEDGKINVVRIAGDYTFPADFMLVCAMNPCPCGYFPDPRCRCSPRQITAYLSKLSRPLADRIDICIDVPSMDYKDIVGKRENESSADIRKRVIKVRNLQSERYKDEGFNFNHQIPPNLIKKYCPLSSDAQDFIREKFEGLSLTARSYHKLIRVGRTIADMEESESILLKHIQEAVCYRMSEGEGIYAKI